MIRLLTSQFDQATVQEPRPATPTWSTPAPSSAARSYAMDKKLHLVAMARRRPTCGPLSWAEDPQRPRGGPWHTHTHTHPDYAAFPTQQPFQRQHNRQRKQPNRSIMQFDPGKDKDKGSPPYRQTTRLAATCRPMSLRMQTQQQVHLPRYADACACGSEDFDPHQMADVHRDCSQAQRGPQPSTIQQPGNGLKLRTLTRPCPHPRTPPPQKPKLGVQIPTSRPNLWPWQWCSWRWMTAGRDGAS